MESALKLKEISYANANGYAAGELKQSRIEKIATIRKTQAEEKPVFTYAEERTKSKFEREREKRMIEQMEREELLAKKEEERRRDEALKIFRQIKKMKVKELYPNEIRTLPAESVCHVRPCPSFYANAHSMSNI